MVAFRKWFPVLAIFAIMFSMATTASAQALTCQANAGVPPIVRAEGFTELTGDIVLTCTGGDPTRAFLANFQVFLNTNVTSRILSGGLTEALLMIDEPASGAAVTGQPVCVSPGESSNPGPQNTGGGNPTSLVSGLGVVSGVNPQCNLFVAGSRFQTGTYNTFRSTRPVSGENSVVWNGVPIVPPGSTTRTIRFTNIRANAAQLGSSNTLIPTQIVAFISVSASQGLAINNPQQTVAFIQPGLLFDVRNCSGGGLGSAGNFSQCVSQLRDLFNDPNRSNSSTAQFAVRFREGFATAFKTIATNEQAAGASVPGVVYNTESGFVRSELGGYVSGGTGVANTGTRLAARFSNIPAGVSIFVGTTDVGSGGDFTSPSLDAVLVTTDANGAGGGTIIGGGTVGGISVEGTTNLGCGSQGTRGAQVALTSGAGLAVWEITAANPSANEQALFLVAAAFAANTPNNLPGIGQASVAGSFAPFYAAGTAAERASSSLPIPRFIDTAQSRTLFRIDECVTNLLFPFVTNQSGFDTGIAVANTSRDIFADQNTRLQNGTCTVNYFGEGASGGAAPAAFTTTENVVAGGRQFTFVLSTGGSHGMDNRGAGFQGYLIIRCRFQYAHGFAFITDGPGGQARVAEGYLALVMDEALSSRTGSFSESLGH